MELNEPLPLQKFCDVTCGKALCASPALTDASLMTSFWRCLASFVMLPFRLIQHNARFLRLSATAL